MASAKLNRIAVIVDSVDAVAASLKQVLDIDLELRSVPELGLKVGLGNSGIELVEQTGETRLAQYWNGGLGALCIDCDDVEDAAARMEKAGFKLVQRVTTSGGMREYYYGANFHGLPMVLHQKTSGDLLHDISGDAAPGKLEVEWLD